jgi:hypothetical protein
MHFANKVIHGIKLSLRCMNNYINAITDHIEIRVGHEDSDFNEGIGG